jgi:hypothetical protein
VSTSYAAASEIFLAACELPLAERAAYLDGACRGDPAAARGGRRRCSPTTF